MSEERKEGATPEIEGVVAPEGEAPGQPTEGNIPPPESSKKKKLRIIVIAASVLVLLGAGALAFFKVPAFHSLLHPHPADNAAKVAQGKAKYTCGMHPFIISDKPGKCPICGMTLTKIEDAAPEAAAAGAAQGGGAGKGERKLLFYRHPMKPGVTSPVPAKDEMGMDYVPVYEDEVGGGGSAVAGYSTIKVGVESLRLAGGQTAPAGREKNSRSVRAGGNVVPDVTLDAPVSGDVTVKEVLEGTRVMPGMELFTVTDLSRIWIEADLYEYEARAVRLGQEANLAPAYDPGLRLKGRVAYVYPTLSPESRTLKGRFEFPNPGLRWSPQMYADVFLELASATGVVIPDSALIETGVRQMVFVDLGGGSLEPREVKVGVRGEGKAQILSGGKEGERVGGGGTL